jgi:formate dehydrogenase subunit gamma
MTARHEDWSGEAARELLSAIDEPGPILVALQALLARFGYVHPDAVPLVATTFNVTRADVYGVLTYYRDLRTTPPCAVEVRVCMGEACQAVGARGLDAAAQALVDADCDVQRVFCMGNCALGPTVVVNDRMLGRVDAEVLGRAVDSARGVA